MSYGEAQSGQMQAAHAGASAGVGWDLGPALQQHVQQALQPVLAEFQQQMAQAARAQMEQALQPDGRRRQQAAPTPDQPSSR